MKIFTEISTIIAILFFSLSLPAKSATTAFNVSSDGNNLTVTTTSSTPVSAGIKSTGFSFSGCTLDTANGYCRFSVTNTQSQNLVMAGPAVTPALSVCSFDANNNIKSCQTISLGARFAYVVDYIGFSVSICAINSNTQQLDVCTVNSDPTFANGPAGIALNPAGTVAYVTTRSYNGGQPNTISICPINPDGSLAPCGSSPAAFIEPWSLALNTTGSMAYVTNPISPKGGNTVSACSLNISDGSFTSCSNFSDASFNYPAGVALNKAGTFVYVVNARAASGIFTVSKCAISAVNGSLSSCVGMADPTFSGPAGITLNSKGTSAYVTNYNITNGTTISLCPINVNRNGIFKPCTALSDPSFSGPIGIQLTADGKFAFITDYTTNQLSICPVNQDGSFGACTANPSPTFRSPFGLVIF